MSYKELPAGLAGAIISNDARQYLVAKGWRRIPLPHRESPGFFGRVAVFEHPESSDEQLLIPLDENTADYDARMAEAIWALSLWENRPPEQVCKDLQFVGSDVLRFRIASPSIDGGVLPLEDGIRLLEGVQKAILAAGHSVLSPALFHKRMSRTEAEELLAGCRMGQTERGSFIATVACPLRAVEQETALIDSASAPFTRRTTTLLMQSVWDLVRAIETDQVQQIVDANKIQPKLSANLCDALLMMKPCIDDADLTIGASWLTLIAAPTSLPLDTAVRIRHSYFPLIEDVYKELRPTDELPPKRYLASVDKLEGTPGADGHMQGLAVLHLYGPEDEDVRARAFLSPIQYSEAVKAHAQNDLVTVAGKLIRFPRGAQLVNPSNFQLFDVEEGI